MPIDRQRLPLPEVCGYTVTEPDGGLYIELHKDFETKRGADRWAFALVAACKPPFAKVTVDCSAFVTLSSTAIAGLVHLADELAPAGHLITLKAASNRVERTLQMMHLDQLFTYE